MTEASIRAAAKRMAAAKLLLLGLGITPTQTNLALSGKEISRLARRKVRDER